MSDAVETEDGGVGPHGDSQVITLLVTMEVKPDAQATFLELTREYIAWVHENEPGTLLYVLTKNPSGDHSYTWVERYRDEAAMLDHRNSERMAQTLPLVRETLAVPGTLLRLQQVFPG